MVNPGLNVGLLPWLTLFSPLAAAAAILVFGIHHRRLSSSLAVGGLALSFVSAACLLLHVLQHRLILPIETAVTWISLPDLTVSFGVLLDPLSLLMTLVVTGVGSGIFLYSTSYMSDDPGYSRYFGVLSLFAFSMLTIVLATNWLQLFLGWELVGFSSYALIGHWYAKPAAADAGKKAFMVNRVADFGFMLGIIALWAWSSPLASERTFSFQVLQARLPHLLEMGWLTPHVLIGIGLLIFCGALGKSAQMPLHVWLPDAMEGPTPVSALIHAATMVAAGVYMLCRAFWLFEHIPMALQVIAWVGGITACAAAMLALIENDLKRILAYSTLSQLGYMVMAVGLGGEAAAMYHLTTHAFFKALLFLAAGSVIHATHRQNIWELGGLHKAMPITSWSFLIGGLALAGFPGLSGFFSKEAILSLAYERNGVLYLLGAMTAALTAFYIARAWLVAFFRPAHDSHAHAHESPSVMTGPLIVLAGLSIVAGYLGLPTFLGEHEAHHGSPVVVAVSLLAVGGGFGLAWLIYVQRAISSALFLERFRGWVWVLERKYGFDQLYNWYVDVVQQRVIAQACQLVERHLIIGFAVNGTAWLTQAAGRVIRRCQTGVIQQYALVFVTGVVVLVYTAIRR